MDQQQVRCVAAGDESAIAAIYEYYVRNTTVTFEIDPPSVEEMRRRIDTTTPAYPWLVAERNGDVVGYACATRFKERAAYRFSVELAVYVRVDVCWTGIGSDLFRELLARVRDQGCVNAFGIVALPNPASVALLERFRFEKVAHLKNAGFKMDRWIDVGYWQLALRDVTARTSSRAPTRPSRPPPR
jgi:phosphinothricin acetyltransferase